MLGARVSRRKRGCWRMCLRLRLLLQLLLLLLLPQELLLPLTPGEQFSLRQS
jgi:hypothetical protein